MSSENPKVSERYSRSEVFGGDPGAGLGVFESWPPANAKKRNRKVPTNSPAIATKVFREV